MIKRYLGNKSEILDQIMSVIQEYCSPGMRVCDIFSGTLTVALELKKRGYSVVANDINLFSAVIGKAYLVNNEIPDVQLEQLVPQDRLSDLYEQAENWVSSLRQKPEFRFLNIVDLESGFLSLLALLQYLQNLDDEDVPDDWLRSDFFDIYTEEGKNSGFVSQRGSTGRRRFFTGSNAHMIDRILNKIRYWRSHHLISEPLYAILLSCLMRAVEKVSNTQGTYHDFPRDKYDPRALKPLRFEAPTFNAALAGGEHFLGQEEDSLEFIKRAPSHQLLYIDPPYNFRQYSAYYFMPNLICRYCGIKDLDGYFANIEYVRGQNMDYNFSSTFCSKKQFIPSLRTLIQRADTQIVMLSYFDGKNHWNDFQSETNHLGYNKLTKLFSSDLFVPKSLQVVPIPRNNYQSYGNHKAHEVTEYLFIAQKRRCHQGVKRCHGPVP
jgi:adenine-specific DNA methylase